MLQLKKITGTVFLFFLSAVLLSQTNSTSQKINGYWEGDFPIGPEIKVVLNFKQDSNYIRLYDGLDKIGEDNINDYSLSDGILSFPVRSAHADINAVVTDNELNAKMLFADGNEVAFSCLKVDIPFFVRDADRIADPFIHIYSPQQLAEDLQFLADTLRKYQPNLYTFSSQQLLIEKYKSILSNLNEGKKELEFLRMLTSLTEKVGCGHLGVSPSRRIMSKQENVKLLPFRVKFIGSDVYIYESYHDELSSEPGIKLQSINGKGVDQIMQILYDGISSDGRNLSTKQAVIEYYLPSLYASHIEVTEEYLIGYQSGQQSEIKTVKISGIPLNELMNMYHTKHPDKKPGSFPLITKNLDGNTTYLKVNQFYYNDFDKYSSFLDSLFQEYKTHQVNNLILDLRGNGGGRPPFSFKMLSMIADKDFHYFKQNIRLEKYHSDLMDVKEKSPNSFEGNVYILMDGACQSSTGHFLALAKYHNWAVTIGRETGSTYYCNDGSFDLYLPNTKIRLHQPTNEVITAVEGFEKTAPFRPDYEIHYTYDDLVNGRDADLEFALNLIKRESL